MHISDWSSDVCSSDLARSDAQRLAHRIDVDAGACALGIFALQQMGDAAGEFDDFQAALDVALRVGQHLAMFGGEQQGPLDRKSVVWGKSGAVRLDLGGRRIITKKKYKFGWKNV